MDDTEVSFFHFSVTYIEGTVSKLIEEKGVVTGVTYKTKDSDEIQVSWVYAA